MSGDYQLGVEDYLRSFDADQLARLDEVQLKNLLGDIEFELDDAENVDTEQYRLLLEMKRTVEAELARCAWTTGIAQSDLQPLLEFDATERSDSKQLSPSQLKEIGQDPLVGDELIERSA